MDDAVYLLPMTEEMYHAYFREFENDPELYLDKAAFKPYVFDPEAVDRYILRQREKGRLCFAVMAGEEIAGELIIKDIVPKTSAVLSVCMKNDRFKGRGYGTQAEQLAVDYVFKELDIPTVLADAIRTNLRSRHVLEKLGFTLTGEVESFKYYRMDRVCKAAVPKKSLRHEEVGEYIRKTCCYITGDMQYHDAEIKPELLFKMRGLIHEMPDERYEQLFPQAYYFDRFLKTGIITPGYETDGCVYMIEERNGAGSILGLKLYNGPYVSLKEKTSCCGNYRKMLRGNGYIYRYKNELDHFITHFIVNYLKGIGFREREAGLKLVKRRVEVIEQN